MTDHLPILQIITPLLAAPLCMLVRKSELVLGITIAVCWATFGMAVCLLIRVSETGVISYSLGGWNPPWGIEYRIDQLSAYVLTFVSGLGAMVATFAPRSVAREIPPDRHYLLFTQYLLCLTGLLGIAATGDMFNLFVFLEISSLSSYALISQGRRRNALTAAFQYLVMGTIGATFILIGIGLMYMATGTLNMIDMRQQLVGVSAQRTILVAGAFLTVGISLKMALFPLHAWLPNAYTFAPSIVTAFLAATATKVSVYILLRFVYTVFGHKSAFGALSFDLGLAALALAGIFVASILAIFQTDLKRMLAFSSIAQIGYMALGISFGSLSGLTAGIVHMFNHALIKGGMFMAVGCLALRIESTRIDQLGGIGRRMPVTMFVWVLGGLGLIGMPGTVGFISKWYLIAAALEEQRWLLAAAVLASSLLAVVYVWRVVETAYFREPVAGVSQLSEAPLGMLIPTCVLIGTTIVFGFWTTASVGVARQAARMLLDTGS